MKTKVCFKCKGIGFTMTHTKYLKILEHNGITKQELQDSVLTKEGKLKMCIRLTPIIAKLQKEHGCKLCHTSGFLHYPKL